MDPTAHVLIGSESFRLWLSKEPLLRRFEIVLTEGLLEDLLIDGVELGVNFEELGEWSRDLSRRDVLMLPGRLSALSPETQTRLLRLRQNTICLAPLKDLASRRCGWLIERMKRITDATGITEYTIQPDEVCERVWARLTEKLPEGIVLSVKNLGRRSGSFRSVSEISPLLQKYPRLRATIDLGHWLELGRPSDDPELLAFLRDFSEQISKLHFSVPRSKCEAYGELTDEAPTHFCAANSGVWISQKFFDSLPSGMKWVVEGLVPLNGVKLLKAELYQLHRLAYRSATDRKVAAG